MQSLFECCCSSLTSIFRAALTTNSKATEKCFPTTVTAFSKGTSTWESIKHLSRSWSKSRSSMAKNSPSCRWVLLLLFLAVIPSNVTWHFRIWSPWLTTIQYSTNLRINHNPIRWGLNKVRPNPMSGCLTNWSMMDWRLHSISSSSKDSTNVINDKDVVGWKMYILRFWNASSSITDNQF